jgi:hypothetical protein
MLAVMSVSSTIERLNAKARGRSSRFSPTITEEGVASFERSNGVSLPLDYREFLLRIGNGGDGPARLERQLTADTAHVVLDRM